MAAGAEVVACSEGDVGGTTSGDVQVLAIMDHTESNTDGKENKWLDDIKETGKKTGKDTVEEDFVDAAEAA